ncbi:MAG: hypothetical protein Kow0025_18820 [Thermodesulfovibrionales bacterium]
MHDVSSLREIQRMREDLKAAQAFPYDETLASVMVGPVFTCGPGEAVRNVAKEMSRRQISSVVVVGPGDEPVGILTERDILNKIIAVDGLDMDRVRVSDVMTPDPVTLTPEDNIYRALSVLSAKGIKHLPLASGGKVAGIVTLRQLLRLRHPEPMVIITKLHEARDVADLRDIKAELPRLAASKLSLGISAYEIVRMISLINQDIHRRVLELALEASGPPPAGFCFFVTGSHGRMENHLTSDQDHGMILADDADDLGYFMPLSALLSEWLAQAGFELCPGYIMAMNPIWRKRLSEWKRQTEYWFQVQVPHLIRYVTLIFDSKAVYGDASLFASMSDHVHALLGRHYEVLRILREEEESHKIPVGLLGRFITEKKGEHKGEMDVKRSGLRFIVEGVRILALLHGIRATSTRDRIDALVRGGHVHRDDGEFFSAAHEILLHFTLKTQVEKALAGLEVDSFIRPAALSQRDREMLRHAFKAVESLQDLIAGEFGQLVL